MSAKAAEKPAPQAPQITRATVSTTPDLAPSTEQTHVQMEHEITVEQQSVIGVEARVSSLEKLRADPDRKDIESLKDLRTHITIWVSVSLIVLGFVVGGIWKFNGIIWSDIILPRLQKQLARKEDPSQSTMS
jgi:hypothetical protein